MTAAVATPKISSARLIVCYAAILGTLPYLILKASWVTGGSIGLRDPSFVDSELMLFANLLTGGMDVVAAVLALAFTYSWGRRIPAPLVLFPIWIGTGLLAPIVLNLPVIVADLMRPQPAELPLENWVWAVVYGGFAWQGVLLLTAFVLYARDRWWFVVTGTARPGKIGAAGALGIAAALGSAIGHTIWAFGSGGMSARGQDVVIALLGVLAGVALATVSRGRFWPRLVLVWTGAGAMAGSGAWGLFSAFAMTSSGRVPVLIVQVIGGVLMMTSVPRRLPHAA
ncbi:hypothetical protein [Amycolatopsis regifaucium]|uniref:Uncharacterized protein n=1 Tax=Amycolatopsis regifaucium TaxID=546365 RepID=A0A154MQE0_9PSEU|nr:hypothetical protein [Amycolatopsis regifaucium]KZB86475.1 hypothetical protein AVL48_27005 [Amycolatopsis regifaucium]OKA06542.1 hypothetical protein ATP06_0224945 [Amycolatopsis regifaucium]SFJ30064.1 hypothetical protein SAMN04489731_11897 [Amycolatopsis regifaucium]